MKKLVAVEDKIIVKVFEKENKTSGGIFIPETAQSQEPQKYGEVLSIGPKVELIKQGDIIMFHERAGMDIMVDRVLYKVVVSQEVYAIVENEEPKNTSD